MLLLTGATGLVGSALLRRLVAEGTPVRCLVRDPRRLGAERVRVQPRGSIEELNGIATWRLVQAAERAGVQRFVFFSALNATTHNRTRFLRAKALAEEAVRGSSLPHVVFAPSIVYAPGDPYLTLLERMALLPVMPVSGRGDAQ